MLQPLITFCSNYPLTRECSDNIKLNPEGGRGLPEQHRSMCCVECGDDHIIKSISMHGHGQGRDKISGAALTIWTLDQPCNPMSKWKAGRTYSGISDLWTDPICTSQLPPWLRTPSCPVLSMLQEDVIYISVDDMMVDDSRGPCMLSIDMKGKRVLSAFIPPPTSEWSEAMRQKCNKEETRDWMKREKSVMFSTSGDAMGMLPQHSRCAQFLTGLRLLSPSRRSSTGPSVGLASLLFDI